MTLEEAMHVSDHLLPGEPGGDEIANWQAQRPQPEPARQQRSPDTASAPEIDWASVIRGALLGERSFLVEAFGQALGEHGNGLLDEVEQMIAQAVNDSFIPSRHGESPGPQPLQIGAPGAFGWRWLASRSRPGVGYLPGQDCGSEQGTKAPHAGR
jgi:hypothetical protein